MADRGRAARVLVTRPEPGATETARRLTEIGFDPVVLPLTRTLPLTPPAFDPSGVDLVVATSANALRYAPPELLAALADRPMMTVGDRTAQVARNAGWPAPVSAGGDVRNLIQQVAARSGVTRIAYLCGRVRRQEFEAEMMRLGLTVQAVEVYDVTHIDYSERELAQQVGEPGIDFVLVYSAEAAAALNGLLASLSIGTLSRPIFLCLSQRIADALNVDLARKRVGERPEQDALFAVLQREA